MVSDKKNKTEPGLFRDALSTVDQQGQRIWLYPKRQKGRYYRARTYLSSVLLLLLFGLPFLKIDGEPLFLFNVLQRQFIIFGIHFPPQDFHLFVLAMLTFLVFIVLFTAAFGRLFCGWVCPQTIFMEGVFRKIEYWIEGDANAQRRLNKSPWSVDKILKKSGKQLLFFAISMLVANTFLAYIIGIDEVIRIATEPVSQHTGGFVAMMLFSGAFYFVFSYMREQVCVTVCPYGRLQSVMLDENSIVVNYDFVRGEPRGKLRKNRDRKMVSAPEPATGLQQPESAAEGINISSSSLKLDPGPGRQGDCIDCKLCVQVCPTGIDIRNGTQMECINCTLCIDACDEVMDKIGRNRGLIRYDSYNGILRKQRKVFTARFFSYAAVLSMLLIVNVVLFAGRQEVETLFLRTPGILFQETADGYISNLYNYQIVNKSKNDITLQFKLEIEQGRLRWVGQSPLAKANAVTKGAVFIDLPGEVLTGRKTDIQIGIYKNEKMIDRISTSFLGPTN